MAISDRQFGTFSIAYYLLPAFALPVFSVYFCSVLRGCLLFCKPAAKEQTKYSERYTVTKESFQLRFVWRSRLLYADWGSMFWNTRASYAMRSHSAGKWLSTLSQPCKKTNRWCSFLRGTFVYPRGKQLLFFPHAKFTVICGSPHWRYYVRTRKCAKGKNAEYFEVHFTVLIYRRATEKRTIGVIKSDKEGEQLGIKNEKKKER